MPKKVAATVAQTTTKLEERLYIHVGSRANTYLVSGLNVVVVIAVGLSRTCIRHRTHSSMHVGMSSEYC